jgi:hypothetical protein
MKAFEKKIKRAKARDERVRAARTRLCITRFAPLVQLVLLVCPNSSGALHSYSPHGCLHLPIAAASVYSIWQCRIGRADAIGPQLPTHRTRFESPH